MPTTGPQPDSPLTPRQARFVSEYLVDLNGRQAAIRAGYSPRTANEQAARLLTKANIQAAVEAGRAAQAQSAELTADWIIRRLKEEAQLTGEGASHAARVKALELLGKRLALWVDRKQVEAGVVMAVTEEIVDAGPQDGPAP